MGFEFGGEEERFWGYYISFFFFFFLNMNISVFYCCF
jgi:hypothetical protein